MVKMKVVVSFAVVAIPLLAYSFECSFLFRLNMHTYKLPFRMVDDKRVIEQDIKRILIERDITTLKQAFYMILCAETQNKATRTFIPHRIFSQDRLRNYLHNKELGFGHQVFESEDYNVYNTIIELVIHELVSDGIIVKQQQAG
jgi:hypothetical protein